MGWWVGRARRNRMGYRNKQLEMIRERNEINNLLTCFIFVFSFLSATF